MDCNKDGIDQLFSFQLLICRRVDRTFLTTVFVGISNLATFGGRLRMLSDLVGCKSRYWSLLVGWVSIGAEAESRYVTFRGFDE